MRGRKRLAGAFVLIAALLAGAPAFARHEQRQAAAEAPSGDFFARMPERDTLTDGFFGATDALEEMGINVSLSLTSIYQANVRGGLSTNDRDGRWAGSWDLELECDMEKLLHVPGGTVYSLIEGSWSEGIGEDTVASMFGINGDAGGNRAVDVTELWYEQTLLGEVLRIRAGKLDLTGGFECRGCPVAFDGNSFANDETAQFLNGALVNNPTIPFPDRGLGIVLYVQPAEWFYVSYGVEDAEADARETGFHTAFHGSDDYFSVFEFGFVPFLPSSNGALPGTYRFGFWYDPQKKDRFDGNGTETDDNGYYLSFDQMFYRESAGEDDTQGFGVFFRLGVADDELNEINTFWSIGCRYQGLIPTRDDDVIGLGVAQGRLSGGAGFHEHRETVIEVYYNARLTPWLNLTPDFQYISNPGGVADDAVALGIRAQMSL